MSGLIAVPISGRSSYRSGIVETEVEHTPTRSSSRRSQIAATAGDVAISLGSFPSACTFCLAALIASVSPEVPEEHPTRSNAHTSKNAILLFFFLRIIIFASAPAVPVFSEQIQDSRCCSHQDQSGNRHCRSCSENGSGS